MTVCAWHDVKEQQSSNSSSFFDHTTSHGICFRCAVIELASRPKVLLRFLLRQGYSSADVLFCVHKEQEARQEKRS